MMKKGNVVEFRHYQMQRKEREAMNKQKPTVSRELEKAIKTLIQKLRKHKPLAG